MTIKNYFRRNVKSGLTELKPFKDIHAAQANSLIGKNNVDFFEATGIDRHGALELVNFWNLQPAFQYWISLE